MTALRYAMFAACIIVAGACSSGSPDTTEAVDATAVQSAPDIPELGQSGSTEAADPGEPAPQTAEPSPTPTPAAPPVDTPEPEPRVPVGEQGAPEPLPTRDPIAAEAMIAAARATFEAGRGNTSVAWDFVDATVLTNTLVKLRICAWGRDSADSELLDLSYRIENEIGSDEVAAVYLAASPVPDSGCLNTTLVESAVGFIDEHDAFLRTAMADPTEFARDRGAAYLGPGHLDRIAVQMQAWVDDELRFEGASYRGDVYGTAVRDVLWRRYESSIGPVFAITVCRAMSPDAATYQAGELIDAASNAGPHSIIEYRLMHDGARWIMAGGNGVDRTDCAGDSSWVAAVNETASATNRWQVLGS